MAQRIRERLPDAPFEALPTSGHWPPLEAPERVAAAVLGTELRGSRSPELAVPPELGGTP